MKHINIRLHRYLLTSVVNRVSVKIPTFVQIEDTLKKTRL